MKEKYLSKNESEEFIIAHYMICPWTFAAQRLWDCLPKTGPKVFAVLENPYSWQNLRLKDGQPTPVFIPKEKFNTNDFAFSIIP